MPLSVKMQKEIDARDTKVHGAIKLKKDGASVGDIEKKTKLERAEVRGSLMRLRRQKRISSKGVARWTKYFAK